MTKQFEKWMKKTFDEPEWDEGWNRKNMEDAFEAGKDSISTKLPVSEKFAEAVYDNLIYDLTDRRGLKQAYWEVDEDVRLELKASWINIIKENVSKFSR